MPHNEPERLAALRRYRILDTPPEAEFDRLARLAAALCGAPVALVSFVDADRQWFKSEIGLGTCQTPLSMSVCAHAIAQDDLLIVPDLLADARFVSNPLVTSAPHLRFYAGAPLKTPDGHRLGTLCVLDYRPRNLEPHQYQALQTLAEQVVTELELRRALTEQNRLLTALEEENQRKDASLTLLAHALRNPIAPISTTLEVLRRAGGQDTTTKWAGDVIRRQTAQLTRVVEDLLDVSQATQGMLPVRFEPVALADFVKDAIEATREQLAGRSQTIEIASTLPPTLLKGDRRRLAQALGNVLCNASQFSPKGERIRLEVVTAERRVMIRVIDDGAGIAADDLDRVFDLFVQLDTTLSRTHGGLGVGLPLARKIVEMHGGTLIAASAGPGQGSVFTIMLPAGRDAGS